MREHSHHHATNQGSKLLILLSSCKPVLQHLQHVLSLSLTLPPSPSVHPNSTSFTLTLYVPPTHPLTQHLTPPSHSPPSPNTSHLPHTPHPHPTPHTSLTLPTLTPHQQLLLNMNFSSRTSSMDVQRTLESNVEKRTKDSFGPPPGKRLLVFIDDMNMPKVYSCVHRPHSCVGWAVWMCMHRSHSCAGWAVWMCMHRSHSCTGWAVWMCMHRSHSCTGWAVWMCMHWSHSCAGCVDVHAQVTLLYGLCGCACTGHSPVRAVWMCMHRPLSCTGCVDVHAQVTLLYGLCGCACTGHSPVRAVWMCMHRSHSCTGCVDVHAQVTLLYGLCGCAGCVHYTLCVCLVCGVQLTAWTSYTFSKLCGHTFV